MNPIPMRFGGYQPPASVHHQAAEIFGAALRTQLGEQVEFSLDGNIMASGHPAADLLSMVESGELTLCYFSAFLILAFMSGTATSLCRAISLAPPYYSATRIVTIAGR